MLHARLPIPFLCLWSTTLFEVNRNQMRSSFSGAKHPVIAPPSGPWHIPDTIGACKPCGGVLRSPASLQLSGLINFPTDTDAAPCGPGSRRVSNGANELLEHALPGDHTFLFGIVGNSLLRDVTEMNDGCHSASCLAQGAQAAQWRATSTIVPADNQPTVKRSSSQVCLLTCGMARRRQGQRCQYLFACCANNGAPERLPS